MPPEVPNKQVNGKVQWDPPQDSHVLNTFQFKNTTFTFRSTQLEITPLKNHKQTKNRENFFQWQMMLLKVTFEQGWTMTAIANGLNKQGLFVKHDGSPLGQRQREAGSLYDSFLPPSPSQSNQFAGKRPPAYGAGCGWGGEVTEWFAPLVSQWSPPSTKTTWHWQRLALPPTLHLITAAQ